jgi:Zn-dependent protease with chaperone function
MVGLIYALAVALLGFQGVDPSTGAAHFAPVWLDPGLLATVVFGVGLVVGGGSAYKMAQLRGGGHVVAEHLGGRLLNGDSRDPAERRLLNVVEEMAVASGTPTPPVYLLEDEEAINAFAAGQGPGDAVIGITRGALEQLPRDELQGVIAHEFSHILNGDMRLNIRLMGVLHGILIIGLLGYFLLRSSLYSGAVRGRGGRDQSVLIWIGFGLGLSLVGFLGTFFGNWIKASVSRQREFLADASAVQFTRNPEGIAGALARIGGFGPASLLETPNAPEASHLFFGGALRHPIFATHPPLEERIRRLDPQLAAGLGAAPAREPSGVAATAAPLAGFAAGGAGPAASVGRPTPEHVDYAARLLASIPADLREAAHEPYSARALLHGLLLSGDAAVRKRQLADLAQHAEAGVAEATAALASSLETLDRAAFLPLVDLLLPALRRLSPDQYRVFVENVDRSIRADDRIDLFEWTLQRVLRTHLRPHFEAMPRSRKRVSRLESVRGACEVLLSTLASADHDEAAARRGFEAASAHLGIAGLEQLPADRCGLAPLDTALDELAAVVPKLKRRLVDAAALCIASDGVIEIAEAELLRATADSLGCPMPPLLLGRRGAVR